MKYYICYEFNCVCHWLETTKESIINLESELIDEGFRIKMEEEQANENGPYTITYSLQNFCGHWQMFAYGVAVD